MKAPGQTQWTFAGGHIPLLSNGPEPKCTSRDELCILNAGTREANIELTIFYTDRDPVGPYKLCVEARRVRRIRINDLIDPLPVPLDVDYGVVATSDVPVVIEFFRIDTSEASG